MKEKVIEILKTIFDGCEINDDASQETIEQWDSMKQLSIAFEIESEFGISLEPDEISKLTSVTNIISILENKSK